MMMVCRTGSRLSDAAAALHHREGSDYYGQTVHPRFGAYRDSSPLWRGAGIGVLFSNVRCVCHEPVSANRRIFVRNSDRVFFPASGTLWNHSTQRFKIESWKQRTANTRVRRRIPRYVYSHYFLGAEEGASSAGAGLRQKDAKEVLANRVVFEGQKEAVEKED